MHAKFEMKFLSVMKKMLGMEISCDRATNVLDLPKKIYVEKIGVHVNMWAAKSMSKHLSSHYKLFENYHSGIRRKRSICPRSLF